MKKDKFQHWMWIDVALVCYDVVFTYLSYIFALLLRFDFKFSLIEGKFFECAKASLFIVCAFTVVCAFVFRLYNSIWRFASVNELRRGFETVIVVTIFNVLLTNIFFTRMPISYYCFGSLLQFLFIVGIRFSYRFLLLIRKKSENRKNLVNVMVVGAGEAGTLITRDINNNDGHEKVVCIIDDNPNKHGRFIDSVKVVGDRKTIGENVRKYKINRIVIAIPSAKRSDIQDIATIAANCECDVKIIPSLAKISKDGINLSDIKDIEISDLLGRDEIKTDLEKVFKQIKNKTILVTGAGGSIGSELVRQIAENDPKQIIMLDIYENTTYYFELELKEKYPGLSLVTLIGSVRDFNKVKEVFNKYKPDIVYHAAAHKHVPLMEDSPNEAIKNNCFGTLNVALAASMYNSERFVLISSDKAVNPTSIMGASKRICEMIIQDIDKCINKGTINKFAELIKDIYECEIKFPKTINTVYSAVRFGNVLGSNGSVVPIFSKQIKSGGPVKVTHPEITRYFMTIPEAVSLVLQSSVYAKGGEIFVLDMGEPIKIVDLAKNMIKLSGKSEEEIKIVFTGLRQGEKLYEERLMDEEGLTKTENDMISICKPLDIKTTNFLINLRKIYKKANLNDYSIDKEIAKIVETYKPKN